MKTVYKYPIPLITGGEETLPLRGKIVHVGTQDSFPDVISVWAEYDDSVEPTDVRLFVVGTGHRIYPESAEHVGSAIAGQYVWHVYREV